MYRFHALFALVLLALSFVSCGRDGDRPNVVLVTLDTTRRDFLSPYNDQASTPAIGRIAAGGATFENAYAPMTVTRPSHATMFTGVYPRTHGVLNNTYLLADERPLLAERFRDAGYRTIAHVGTGLFKTSSGFLRGFERTNPGDEKSRDATQGVERALASLRSGDGRPFFLWLHLFDAHFAYTPPVEYLPEGEWASRVPQVNHAALRAESEPRGGDVSRAFYDHARALYAAEIAHMDDALAKLDAWLLEAGLRERTVFVVVADHGEGFEQGIFFAHAPMITEPGITVPFIVRGPGIPPARHAELASLTDLAPTILALAGLDPLPDAQGRSLAPLFQGKPIEPAPAYFAYGAAITDEVLATKKRRVAKNEIRRRAFVSVDGERRTDLDPYRFHDGVIWDGWKLVVREDEPVALYDLRTDPQTLDNRIESEGERARDLALLRRDYLARIPESGDEAPPVLTEEEAARLRALGYMD
ncbi:MAG: sulfatase [Gemmatimonadetes bacterium]|nr:sulfatase [Gemmatimonadota bacterium]